MPTQKKFKNLVFIVAAVAVSVVFYLLTHAGQESTDDATIEAHVINLSPKVPGYIVKMNVLDNQQVKAGDVLFEIDDGDYILRRERAVAALDSAKAALAASGNNLATTKVSAPSNIDVSMAQLKAAEANYDKAANDLKRMKNLNDDARSREQLDNSIAAEKSAKSNLEDAKAKLRTAQTAPKTIAAAQANKDQLEAEVKKAQIELYIAEKDLHDTKVLAPIDGRITRKSVDRGDYVTTGQAMGYLVGEDRWVIANFKETQLKHMKPGQRVSIEVDAFPHQDLKGKIDSIQYGTGARFSAFPPENATGNFVKIVQRVPVKILLDDAIDSSIALGPGMSVIPTVYTQ